MLGFKIEERIFLKQDQLSGIWNSQGDTEEFLRWPFILGHPLITHFLYFIFSGEPQCYCNYAFKTLDKDNSGIISFDEFMSAIALTLPGDIEYQLALVRTYPFLHKILLFSVYYLYTLKDF